MSITAAATTIALKRYFCIFFFLAIDLRLRLFHSLTSFLPLLWCFECP